jgi:tetratricopeptide (TPR) repeat protein
LSIIVEYATVAIDSTSTIRGPHDASTGAGEVRSEIGRAQVSGDVVQARDVSGGVHFHTAERQANDSLRIPRQLPADVSLFVNRRTELRRLTRLLAGRDRRAAAESAKAATVVVITGSAGVGKTALALHWAHDIREHFPNGELYANLRGFDDGPAVTAGTVLDRFLRDLGVEPSVIPADLDGRAALFRSRIAGQRMLVVLDNVADIGQVRPLIPGSPGPLVVITSRNQLAGLAIRDGAQRTRLDIFQESDAVALVRQVTRTGGRRDAPADLLELAQLCARLPLALRVAAEHAISRPAMQLAELIADLRDDSLLWDALSVGDGPQGEGVRTVFTWSYRDLPEDAACMFRVLGLHQGPDISLDAAAAALGVPERNARRALDMLLGAFLVQSSRSHRYELHDLLRAYALDQARATDTEAARRDALDRILCWYITGASRAAELLSPGDRYPVDVHSPEGPAPLDLDTPAAALAWFDLERPNLVVIARTALEAGLPRRAWELGIVLSSIHARRFTFDDWDVHTALAVSAAETMDDRAALAAALDIRGQFLFRRRQLDDAWAAHTRALAVREELGDRAGTRRSLNALGLVCLRTRELGQAAAYFTDLASRASADQDRHWEGVGRTNLAEAQLEAADIPSALATIGPLPEFFADRGEPDYEGNALWLLAWAQRLAGDLPSAQAAIDRALTIAEQANNRASEAWWLVEAARVHLAAGEPTQAMDCCRMAASLERQIGDHSREATALDCTGEVLFASGNIQDAADFHREAARMHRELGDQWQEAQATLHLADCEQALSQAEASREQLTAALTLLQPFPDPRAAALRAAIQARLD